MSKFPLKICDENTFNANTTYYCPNEVVDGNIPVRKPNKMDGSLFSNLLSC